MGGGKALGRVRNAGAFGVLSLSRVATWRTHVYTKADLISHAQNARVLVLKQAHNEVARAHTHARTHTEIIKGHRHCLEEKPDSAQTDERHDVAEAYPPDELWEEKKKEVTEQLLYHRIPTDREFRVPPTRPPALLPSCPPSLSFTHAALHSLPVRPPPPPAPVAPFISVSEPERHGFSGQRDSL